MAMQNVMNRRAPVGIAVAAVRDGRLLAAKAYGHADIAGAEPLRRFVGGRR
jgi:CubicO group peptidase (beta-lactamase class C family)